MTKCDVSRCRKESEIGYTETTGVLVNLCDKHYKEWCDKDILFVNKKLGVLMMVRVSADVSKALLLPIPQEKKVEVVYYG